MKKINLGNNYDITDKMQDFMYRYEQVQYFAEKNFQKIKYRLIDTFDKLEQDHSNISIRDLI